MKMKLNDQYLLICKWGGRGKRKEVLHWWVEPLGWWSCYLMRGRRGSGELGYEQVRRQNGDKWSLELFRFRYLHYILVKCWRVDCNVGLNTERECGALDWQFWEYLAYKLSLGTLKWMKLPGEKTGQ